MKFYDDICSILTHVHSNLGSRGGKYSGLTNAEICKKYRESMAEAKKEKKNELENRGGGKI